MPTPRQVYLLIALLGTALPLWAFLPWLQTHGLALHLLLVQASATPLSAFAWADVLVSALALLAFIAFEQRRRPVPRLWLPLLGLCCVGVSLALPLYLYQREGDPPRA